MFIFITSLRHPHNCYSYERVAHLLDQTLESVCTQTSNDFHVIIVCNEVPEIARRRNVEFVKVDFPPPSRLRCPTTGMAAIRVDRGSKYAVGLIYARQYTPDYVMFFDADDYINRRIVEYVGRHPIANGWYFKHGYVYQHGSSRMSLLEDFHKRCGTSHIFNFALFEFAPQLTIRSSLESLTATLNKQYLTNVLGSHKTARRYYQNKGIDLEVLPFAGAVWVLGNGENHSGLGGDLGNLTLTKDLVDEFNIPV